MGAVSAARLLLLSILLAAGALAGCGASGLGSVGAVFGRDNETRALHVREVPEGAAAGRAGLAAGDEVVMIDGVYVRDLAAPEIRAKLRGDPGTEVALTVVRGEQVRHVKLVRAPLGAARAKAPREEKIAE